MNDPGPMDVDRGAMKVDSDTIDVGPALMNSGLVLKFFYYYFLIYPAFLKLFC